MIKVLLLKQVKDDFSVAGKVRCEMALCYYQQEVSPSNADEGYFERRLLTRAV